MHIWQARLWRRALSPYSIYRHYPVLHAVRVGLAYLLTVALVLGFDIPHGEWMSITVLIVMGSLPHLGSIFKKARQRAIGTAAGALAGILMLPAMYLLGKQLTKKSSFAFAAALMLALDCQHFTQTRIATIDSYPVLFILFSWLFMLRFMQRDIVRLPVKKLLPDLALSGLFMGLGIASKWIGVYSGAGLAVAFFWTIFRHMRMAARTPWPTCAERASIATRCARTACCPDTARHCTLS